MKKEIKKLQRFRDQIKSLGEEVTRAGMDYLYALPAPLWALENSAAPLQAWRLTSRVLVISHCISSMGLEKHDTKKVCLQNSGADDL